MPLPAFSFLQGVSSFFKFVVLRFMFTDSPFGVLNEVDEIVDFRGVGDLLFNFTDGLGDVEVGSEEDPISFLKVPYGLRGEFMALQSGDV